MPSVCLTGNSVVAFHGGAPAAGSLSAAQVIATHERLIRSRCRLWRIDPHEHEDLVSEAMLAALASLASWCASGGASLSTWICRHVDRRLGALARRSPREPLTVSLEYAPQSGPIPVRWRWSGWRPRRCWSGAWPSWAAPRIASSSC